MSSTNTDHEATAALVFALIAALAVLTSAFAGPLPLQFAALTVGVLSGTAAFRLAR